MRFLHIIFTLVFSALLIFATRRSPFLTLVICFGGIWSAFSIAYLRRARWTWVGCATFLGLLLALLSFQFLRRIGFMFLHGLDRPDGSGSPLAFVIGFAFEIALLTPTVVFAAWLWRVRPRTLSHDNAA